MIDLDLPDRFNLASLRRALIARARTDAGSPDGALLLLGYDPDNHVDLVRELARRSVVLEECAPGVWRASHGGRTFTGTLQGAALEGLAWGELPLTELEELAHGRGGRPRVRN